MNGSGSLAYGYKCYQNLRVVDDMNTFRSSATLGYELRDLDAIKNSGQWSIRMTLGYEMRALNVIKTSRVWMA